jgi:hypothetical protein
VADPGRGIRQFVVGTGGASLSSLDGVAPNSQVRDDNTHGVLKLTLHPTSYDWEFIPIAGQTFTDSGSALCVTSLFNQAPVANDESSSTQEDTPVTIDVAVNDSDPDGNLDPTSANTACTTCAEPANGVLVNNSDGTFDYIPNPDFNGPDSFVYDICDTGLLCDMAMVNITVDAVNDPPVANDDSAGTQEDTPVTIDVAVNDSDPVPLVLSLSTGRWSTTATASSTTRQTLVLPVSIALCMRSAIRACCATRPQ